jgi:phosphoribosylaminoimidazole (AIR) synthetase
MPGVYAPHQWDLAGCCVGVKEAKSKALPAMNE